MTGKNKKVDFNYVNRSMKFRPDYSMNKLVCISNGKEVLRITRDKAEGYVNKKSKKWFYTTKAIYKQYIESLKPGSKIPVPKFTMQIMNHKGEKKIINTHVYQ